MTTLKKWKFFSKLGSQPPLKSAYPGSCPPKKLFLGRFFLENHVFDPFGPMKTPKCYTWLESCGSHLSDGIKKKIFFCILWSVWFSMTVRTDIFLYTEKLSYSFSRSRKVMSFSQSSKVMSFSQSSKVMSFSQSCLHINLWTSWIVDLKFQSDS